jgi:hypothetical protein
LPVFDPRNVGDDGLSTKELWYDDSTDDAELGYLKCPWVEKVGVMGDGTSEGEEFRV